MSLSNNTDKLLINLMSASAQRFDVLSSNLANANTPGYTRSTVEFEDLLAKEVRSMKPNLLSVKPKVVEDLLTPSSPDGNNVNAELEMNGLLQNRMQYELYSTLLAGRMELLRTAIAEGR